METAQPWQLLTALGVVSFIGAMLLIWGDRPGLAAAIRRRFMSSDEAINQFDGGSEPPEPYPVLPDANRAEPLPAREFDAVLDFLAGHKLSNDEAVRLFALARRLDGEHFLSANKILDAVGGTAADVKAQVAALRPKPAPLMTSGRHERPAGGW